jgi:hypothetical protein
VGAGLLVLLVAVPAGAFVPGFLLLRRVALADEDRFLLSVALSLAFLYLVSFSLFLAGAGRWGAVAAAATVAVAGILARGELRTFLSRPAVVELLLPQAIFTAWVLLLSLFVESFSGAGWMGDWAEHFGRALVFCGEASPDVRFLDEWPLTARPPLANLVTAFFMRLSGTDFAPFQLATVLAGSVVFTGAAAVAQALAPGLGRRPRAALLALVALLCLNPSVAQNATYTWTRAPANFLVLAAAALWVRAVREGTPALRRWAYLLLGLACVTHYSAGPYVVGLALVEAWLLATRRLAAGEAARCALLLAAPLATWLAWAVAHFGVAATFASNSTVAWNARLGPVGVARRVLANAWATLVPHPLRRVEPIWAQELALARARDYWFLVYQTSLLPLMGAVGGVAVAWRLVAEGMRRVRARAPEQAILVALFLATVVGLGIATVAVDDPYGTAHNCLQPLALAGLAWLAVRWTRTGAAMRWALGAGLAVDAVLGVGLHFRTQALGWDEVHTFLPLRWFVTRFFRGNFEMKEKDGLVFLSDLPGSGAAIALLGLALAGLVALAAHRARAEARTAPGPGAC